MLEYKQTFYATKSLDELISRMENSGEDDSALNMIVDFEPATEAIKEKLDKIVDRCNDETDKLWNWSTEDLIGEVEKIKEDIKN